MSAVQGIKKHGEKDMAAMFKELKQLDVGAMDGKPVIAPIDAKSLTTMEKEQALEAVNLIKEKRNGDLKGHTCGNGAQQRRFMKEDDDILSPTASLDAISTTLAIDTHEERDVAIVNVSGAYLHAEEENDFETKGDFC